MVVECWTCRWPPVWEIAVQLAVACDVYDGVFCAFIFPKGDFLDEILNFIESVSEVFPTYSFIFNLFNLLECPFMLITLILVIKF